MTTIGTPPWMEIRTRREALGLSRSRLAAIAGCSYGYLEVLEAGVKPKKSTVVPRILQALEELEQAAESEPSDASDGDSP